jgi:hypothetical protein
LARVSAEPIPSRSTDAAATISVATTANDIVVLPANAHRAIQRPHGGCYGDCGVAGAAPESR